MTLSFSHPAQRPRHSVTVAQWLLLRTSAQSLGGWVHPESSYRTPARNLVLKGYGYWQGSKLYITKAGRVMVGEDANSG